MKPVTELKQTKEEKIVSIHEKEGIRVRPGDVAIRPNESYSDFYYIESIDKTGAQTLRWNGEEWKSYSHVEFYYLKHYVKAYGATKENIAQYLEEKLKEAIVRKEDEELIENVDEHALVIRDKSFYEVQKRKMEEMSSKHAVLEKVLHARMDELNSVRRKFETQIEKLNKVIGTIALYLGIEEDIVQIRDGMPSAPDTPICLRQKILFMDEEYGAVMEDGNFDYTNIEDFDKWLVQNYKSIMPEEKGVVVLRPRRTDKNYSEDRIANFFANQPNRVTYIFIRNGEKLYRIFSSVRLRDRLFPKRDELQDLLTEKEDDWGSRVTEKEDTLFTYKQNILLLQGLLDRTQVFIPLATHPQLFKPETCENIINFVYDDELALPNGRLMWRDWKKKINSEITQGSRIYFSGFSYNQGYSSAEDKRIRNRNIYDSPKNGVYTVEYFLPVGKYYNSDGGKFKCKWLPTDKVYFGYYETKERTRKVSFTLDRDDEWVLNYDAISLDDVEYYIKSRVDRHHYIDMMPALKGIRKARIEEIAWEKEFVKLLASRTKADEKKIWSAIEWWKLKNKWKRPIMKDDAKALRMIEKRVSKQ